MINKEILARIVKDFESWQVPELIERDIKVTLDLPINRATAIIGPRRAGKTSLMYSLIGKLIKDGVKKDRILYVNFETPKLLEADAFDLESLLELMNEISPPKKNDKNWLFFDEIQLVKKWETGIRSLLDKGNNKIFLTGSSSNLLSKEIATGMRGRTISRVVLPFSFNEFLKFKNIKTGKYYSTVEIGKMHGLFVDYLKHGGYPEAVLHKAEWEKIINEILEVTIYRDVIERHRIRNTKAVKLMLNQLIRAKEFSVHGFFNYLKSLNFKISKNTLYEYLEYFSDAFVFFPLYKYSPSIKITDQSIPKMYVVDNALISSISSGDKGKKLENLVLLELLRRGYETNKSVFYYSDRTGEVDFVLKEGSKVVSLIQVCYDISDYVTKKRELDPLLKTSGDFRCKDLKVITNDYEAKETHNGKKVVFVPAWKWLTS